MEPDDEGRESVRSTGLTAFFPVRTVEALRLWVGAADLGWSVA